MRALLTATAGPKDQHKHLLLAWLYETGVRISDSLRLHDDDLTLPAARARIGSSKTDDHGEIGISPELVALLATTPRTRAGKVFPWRDHHGVYRWLRPLCAALCVSYTPHLSRHALATDLRALGLGHEGDRRAGCLARRAIRRALHAPPGDRHAGPECRNLAG